MHAKNSCASRRKPVVRGLVSPEHAGLTCQGTGRGLPEATPILGEAAARAKSVRFLAPPGGEQAQNRTLQARSGRVCVCSPTGFIPPHGETRYRWSSCPGTAAIGPTAGTGRPAPPLPPVLELHRARRTGPVSTVRVSTTGEPTYRPRKDSRPTADVRAFENFGSSSRVPAPPRTSW